MSRHGGSLRRSDKENFLARDGSGNFSLVAGNPVVTGTTITITWANSTLSDIATALTASVARDGQAAMTGALNMGSNAISSVTTIAASGAITAASLIPTSAMVPANGMYLSAANTLAFATNSVQRATIDTSGNLVITGSLTAVNAVLSGAITAVGATLTGTITVGGVNVTNFARLDQSNLFSGATAIETLQTTGTNAAGLQLNTNSTSRATINAIGANDQLITGSLVADLALYVTSGRLIFGAGGGGAPLFTMSQAGNFDFKAGTVTTTDTSASEVGRRGAPRVTATPGTGECLAVSAGFTLNTGLSAGKGYSIYNDSAAQITVTQGAGLTLRLAGTASTGNRTIEARGLATFWVNSTTEYIMTGAGVG